MIWSTEQGWQPLFSLQGYFEDQMMWCIWKSCWPLAQFAKMFRKRKTLNPRYTHKLHVLLIDSLVSFKVRGMIWVSCLELAAPRWCLYRLATQRRHRHPRPWLSTWEGVRCSADAPPQCSRDSGTLVTCLQKIGDWIHFLNILWPEKWPHFHLFINSKLSIHTI